MSPQGIDNFYSLATLYDQDCLGKKRRDGPHVVSRSRDQACFFPGKFAIAPVYRSSLQAEDKRVSSLGAIVKSQRLMSCRQTGEGAGRAAPFGSLLPKR